MTDKILLVGASGLAKEVICTLEDSDQYQVEGIVDDDTERHGSTVLGVPVLGPIEAVVARHGSRIVLCVGRGQGRERIATRLSSLGVGLQRYATVIDRSVRVPSSCRVGRGCILLRHTSLTADVTIGNHVVIMPNATLTHDDVVDDYATLCAGVSLGGCVRVERAAYLGMNSSVREGLNVGAGAVLGMGAVLLRCLPSHNTWAGVPARPLRDSSGVPSAPPPSATTA